MIALEFHKTVVVPGLTFMTVMLGPAHGDTKWEDDARARVLLNAMAGQETGWQNIPQLGDGPGRGPWQLGEEGLVKMQANIANMAAPKIMAVNAATTPIPT